MKVISLRDTFFDVQYYSFQPVHLVLVVFGDVMLQTSSFRAIQIRVSSTCTCR
jgi:hypothetical protein